MKYKLFIALVALFIISCCLLQGCFSGYTRPPASVPEQIATPASALTKIVVQTNWLATFGLLTGFAGVIAYFNSPKLGMSLIAGGVALAGAVVAYAAINQLVQSWLPWLEWGVPILGILATGLWAWNHYGRSQQIKALLGK
jgi:hypothetical protein